MMRKFFGVWMTGMAMLAGTAALAGHVHGPLLHHGVSKTVVADQAGELANAIEALDERLHALKAPAPLIELAHHTEETVLDMVDILLEPQIDKVILDNIARHVRLDVRELQNEIYHHYRPLAYTLHNELYDVSRADRQLTYTYRMLDLSIVEPQPGPGPQPQPGPGPQPQPGPGPQPQPGPGPQPGPSVLSLNGKTYQKLGEGNLVSTPTSVSGVGTLIFDQILEEDENDYALKTDLKAGGSLTLIVHSDDQLAGGLALTLVRKAGDKLGVILKNGGKQVDVSADFEEITLSENPLFEIDVHNDEGHVIFWIDGGEEIELATGSNSGKRLGLSLNQVTVTQADVKPPKEEH